MKQELNQLIQLQELNFALAEQAASKSDKLKSLEEAIGKLIEKLPEDIASRYQRMHKSNNMVVVPIVHGNCTGCGMAMPSGMANEIVAGKNVQTCPHCGRFLYYNEALPRRPQKPAEKRPLDAGITRFSDVQLMVPRLAAKTREDAIAELATLMSAQGFVENPESLADMALRREAMVSTAVEHGLAFPHVRNVEGGSLTFALGLKPTGLKFGTSESQLTKLVFFIVIPTAASAFYLRLLAGLIRTFSETENRNKLLKCETPDTMWKTLAALTRETIR